MKKGILVVTIIAIFTLISSLAYAEEVAVYKGISEAVSILENGELGNTSTVVPSNSTIRVQLDGSYLDFTDSEGNVANPQIMQNRTMVPMRKIFETFSATVSWDEPTRTIVAKTDEKEITLTIDNNVAKVKNLVTGEEKELSLDQAPVIYQNRTLVPIRFIAESLDKEVGWDNNTRTVIIIDMNKLTKMLSSRVTALQKLFDMNIEEVSSFKSTSTLSGSIDLEDNGVAQNISINGDAKVCVNKSEDMESELNVTISGSEGQLLEAIKNSGYEKINAKVVLKGDKLYIGLLDGGEYKWTDATSSMDSINNISLAYNVDKISNYGAVMEFIKSTIGELNQDSYNTMISIINAMGLLINDNNVVLTEESGVKTLKMDLDFGSFLSGLMTNGNNVSLKMNVTLVASNGKIQKELIEINSKFDLSGEDVGLKFNIDSNYLDLNQDFAIEEPKV